MAMKVTSQEPKPTMPVGRESVLHSEPTIYHPTAEAYPEQDAQTSSVPSAKKYLLWLAVAVVLIVAVLILILNQ